MGAGARGAGTRQNRPGGGRASRGAVLEPESAKGATPQNQTVSRDAQGRFVVTLPYPPSVNHLWRHVGARTLLSAEGRRYHEEVGVVVSLQSQGIPEPPHAVTILAVLPDRRKRDIDNILKALLDPLYRAIGLDDSVVSRLTIEKVATDSDGPRVRVVIEHARPPGAG